MDDNTLISITDFDRVDIRVGQIVASERVPKSSKLLKLQVYCGEECGTRTVMAGIAKSYDADAIVGQGVLVVVNLPPREMAEVTSNAMLLAGKNPETGLVTLATCPSVPCGTRIG